MNAADFDINFPYGSILSPYSKTHPHRGDDRPCPAGTPIVINDKTIGLTGFSGYIKPPGPAGAHLHIQEWKGDYPNTRKPQNAFNPGMVVNIDPTGSQGDGTFGLFITIQTDDGWNDTYCHLSRIDVEVGDIIGDSMVIDDPIFRRIWSSAGFDVGPGARQPTKEEVNNAIGRDYNEFMDYWLNTEAVKERITKGAFYDQDVANAGNKKFKPYKGPQLGTIE